MTQIEKIKSEIERRILEDYDSDEIAQGVCAGLHYFIKSLEQEQAQGLGEAAEEYSKCYAHCFNGNSLDDAIYLAFKAGAKWMDEQGNDNLPKVRGCVARDPERKNNRATNKGFLFFSAKKLIRDSYAYDDCTYNCWAQNGDGKEEYLSLPTEFFPELTFFDEPIEVELTIKKHEEDYVQ